VRPLCGDAVGVCLAFPILVGVEVLAGGVVGVAEEFLDGDDVASAHLTSHLPAEKKK
jgi:hypothetical protein